jgi:hypothetical protein
MTLADGTSLTPTPVTFTASSHSISTYTTNAAMIGTYSLLIKGTVTGYTNTNSVAFTLNVNDACSVTTITSTSISSYSYDIDAGTTNTIVTLAWTKSSAYCTTSITYAV